MPVLRRRVEPYLHPSSLVATLRRDSGTSLSKVNLINNSTVVHEVRCDVETVDDGEATSHVVPKHKIEEVVRIFSPGHAPGH